MGSARHRIVQFGVFEADFLAGEFRKQGLKIRLSDQCLQILQQLVERPGEVVTREELRQKLWPGDTFVDFEAGLKMTPSCQSRAGSARTRERALTPEAPHLLGVGLDEGWPNSANSPRLPGLLGCVLAG